MLFRRNIYRWEQALRLCAGLAMIVVAVAFDLPSPWPYLLGATGAFIALTGVLGYCPACGAIGRRLPEAER